MSVAEQCYDGQPILTDVCIGSMAFTHRQRCIHLLAVPSIFPHRVIAVVMAVGRPADHLISHPMHITITRRTFGKQLKAVIIERRHFVYASKLWEDLRDAFGKLEMIEVRPCSHLQHTHTGPAI